MTASCQQRAVDSMRTGEKRMTRKFFVFACLLSTVILVTGFPADAQQPKKVPRIGYLAISSVAGSASRLAALRQGLRELGYVEGKNVILEIRSADGNRERGAA